MNRLFILLILLILSRFVYAQEKDSTPEFVIATMVHLSDSIQLDEDNFLIGDFNADLKPDFASLFVNLENGLYGLIIFHQGAQDDFQMFGAGRGVDLKYLDWVEVMRRLPKGEEIAPTIVENGDIVGPDLFRKFILLGDGIYLTVEESHGGEIIYWNGVVYDHMHVD